MATYNEKTIFLSILIFLTPSCKNSSKNQAETGWKLVWQDEFNYSTQELNNNWNFEEGYGQNGWGNDEWQNYTSQNAQVQSGNLIITAMKNKSLGKRDGSITSSRIQTLNKFEFKPGTKIKARIKLPWGQGIWPAFWALGTDFPVVGWPSCGEIDILELVGANPKSNSKNFTVHSTTHWNDVNDPKNYKHANYGKPINLDLGFIDKFHIYELNYESDYIQTKIDGKEIFKIDTNIGNLVNHFNKPFFLILNIAVGGYWPGQPTKETVFPQQMLVDYIRAYQKI